jgi:2-dehydro-3-deoxyglucarate aldolase/4-hydroxy-2-oxoheptanedioate aldolase
MKANRLREALQQGRVPLGHMVWEFSTRGMATILDSVDLDFVLFDMEHSGIEMERIFDLIAWSKAASFAPCVRVPQAQYHFLARVMDAGALGVMVANVESAVQAREIVRAVKYAPLGQRGVGLGCAHTDYVVPPPVEYFAESNANSVVICQIESERGVEQADAIAAVEGVDILWIGHFDLSQSMGLPGQFHHPRFVEAFRHVATVTKRQGKGFGAQPGTLAQAEEWRALGVNVISWNVDVAVYRQALTQGVQQLRELLR